MPTQLCCNYIISIRLAKKVSVYDQEIPQSRTADLHNAPQGIDRNRHRKNTSQDSRKTIKVNQPTLLLSEMIEYCITKQEPNKINLFIKGSTITTCKNIT